jgi:hypothetical protein
VSLIEDRKSKIGQEGGFAVAGGRGKQGEWVGGQRLAQRVEQAWAWDHVLPQQWGAQFGLN